MLAAEMANESPSHFLGGIQGALQIHYTISRSALWVRQPDVLGVIRAPYSGRVEAPALLKSNNHGFPT